MMPFYSLMNITNLNQALSESGVGDTYLITDLASEAHCVGKIFSEFRLLASG